MARATAGGERRVGGVGRVAKVDAGDAYRVIFHLTVRSLAGDRHRAIGGAAEAANGIARHRAGGHGEGEIVDSRRQRHAAREEILARAAPVAIAVKVDPSGESAGAGRGHINTGHRAAD